MDRKNLYQQEKHGMCPRTCGPLTIFNAWLLICNKCRLAQDRQDSAVWISKEEYLAKERKRR